MQNRYFIQTKANDTWANTDSQYSWSCGLSKMMANMMACHVGCQNMMVNTIGSQYWLVCYDLKHH